MRRRKFGLRPKSSGAKIEVVVAGAAGAEDVEDAAEALGAEEADAEEGTDAVEADAAADEAGSISAESFKFFRYDSLHNHQTIITAFYTKLCAHNF